MDKCPKCGYEPEKQYCQCKYLTIFDLLYNIMDSKEYCRKCDKKVETHRVNLILAKGV